MKLLKKNFAWSHDSFEEHSWYSQINGIFPFRVQYIIESESKLFVIFPHPKANAWITVYFSSLKSYGNIVLTSWQFYQRCSRYQSLEYVVKLHMDGLMQDCSISTTNALEILQSCSYQHLNLPPYLSGDNELIREITLHLVQYDMQYTLQYPPSQMNTVQGWF